MSPLRTRARWIAAAPRRLALALLLAASPLGACGFDLVDFGGDAAQAVEDVPLGDGPADAIETEEDVPLVDTSGTGTLDTSAGRLPPDTSR